MHGTLNDFALVDSRRESVDDLRALAKRVCDRHAGLGADGLLSIERSKIADVRMRIVNADGSEAQMCGNGVRCVARYLAESGEGQALTVETEAGVIQTQVLTQEPEFLVRVGMGKPIIDRRALPFSRAHSISLGNPHVVIFDQDVEAFNLPAAAVLAQRTFPDGVNVHVAAPERGELRARHWERGVGLTMACGTGAVAVAAAAIAERMLQTPVTVRVPGGHLRVDWDGLDQAYLTGPAVRVFDGELYPDVVRV